MRVYKTQHRYYCGVDLHARSLFVNVLDHTGTTLFVLRDMPASLNDRLDAEKTAGLLKGGFFPMAYVYPKAKRKTRDLLRRRSFFVRQRAQLIAHIQNTNSQYNLPPFDKKLTYKGNRSAEIAERFVYPSTLLSIDADLALIEN